MTLIIAQLVKGLLHGVSAADPATFAVVPIGFGLLALLASYIQARKAAGVDPMVSLRAE